MAKDKIDFIESMKILKCEPGDIVVLKIDMKMDEEVRRKITNSLEGIVKNKVLILEKGVDIGVFRKKQGAKK